MPRYTSTLFTISFLLLLSSSFISTKGSFEEEVPETIHTSSKCLEQSTRLHFYLHDIISGKNPTAVRIAGPPNSTFINFGNTMMIDDPLTEGPETTSKLVGKAQGLYALAARDDFSLLVVMNFAFLEGKYNGSTISILGRNPIAHTVREMPIVGGSGVFRLARGSALAHPVWVSGGDATVEYNVSVLHPAETCDLNQI
ncbi:dirigent protein 22-like [Malania oleifera]|uniref:dirigent protein 22-like n=1 Tax=Malania oleifera TaxID=397392 RepID=UPI0025AD9FCE|nr:dirigent protein 22-like [Malania oleifera]